MTPKTTREAQMLFIGWLMGILFLALVEILVLVVTFMYFGGPI